MTPQELKNSILQRAIQGKLVEQRPEEGTGEELYRQIQAEKRRLIKEKKIKREKPLPEITEDEIPFEIPESWKWVRIVELGEVVGGGTPKTEYSDYWDESGIPWLTPADMKYISGKYAKRGERNISVKGLGNSSARLMPKGTILYSSRAPIGYIAIAANEISTNQGFKSLVPVIMQINEYIYYCLTARTQDIIRRASGTTFKEISGSDFGLTLIPLPPLAEQQRIVAKIEELSPYIDRYAAAWNRLEEINRKFPADMRKSLLQWAIQGKLVEQRPEEGTGEELYREIQAEKRRLIEAKKIKKEKPLPEIAEDEIPFEIPGSWKWVRLGSLIHIESGRSLTSAQMVSGSIPVYGGNGITGYHNQSFLHRETVIIGRVGFHCGSVHITEKESWVTDNAFIVSYPENLIDRRFLVYSLRHMNLGHDSNATAQPVVSGKKIYPLLFSLPPLTEQRRIAARLEELLPLCERLKE